MKTDKKNDCEAITQNIIAYVGKNSDKIAEKFSRDNYAKYERLIEQIDKQNKKMVEIQKQIAGFFIIRRDSEQTARFLQIAENVPSTIEYDNMFELYKKYFYEFKKITGKNEKSFTSKILHLKNRKFPILDSRVEKFLKLNGMKKNKDVLEQYKLVLEIYENLLKNNQFLDLIEKLKTTVYGKHRVQEINNVKFLDTMFYSINDGEEI